jgi:hypothetical protein
MRVSIPWALLATAATSFPDAAAFAKRQTCVDRERRALNLCCAQVSLAESGAFRPARLAPKQARATSRLALLSTPLQRAPHLAVRDVENPFCRADS